MSERLFEWTNTYRGVEAQAVSRALWRRNAMSGPFDDGRPEEAALRPGSHPLPYRGAKLANVVEAPSYVERLYARKVELEAEVKKLDEALEALKKNPEMEKVLHAITRVGGLY